MGQYGNKNQHGRVDHVRAVSQLEHAGRARHLVRTTLQNRGIAVIIGGWRGIGWRVVDASPRRSAEIRHWVTAVVVRHGRPVNRDDVALVVTELFVNAVVHGPVGGRVLIGYCLWRGGVRIVVCDGGGPSEPQLGHAGNQAERLRGLQIVDALAVRWGHFRVGTARIVWCDLGGPMRVPASDAWARLRLVLSTSARPPVTAVPA